MKETFEEAIPKQNNIYVKLLRVKSEIGKLTKKADNPFFKSKYLDLSDLLEAVEPVLEKHGLVLLQPIQEGKVFTIITDSETTESVTSYLDLPINNNPQQMGSAVTYYRRYTLQSLLSLQAVDDDGNTASKPKATLNDNKFKDAITALKAGKITKGYLTTTFDLTMVQLTELETV